MKLLEIQNVFRNKKDGENFAFETGYEDDYRCTRTIFKKNGVDVSFNESYLQKRAFIDLDKWWCTRIGTYKFFQL